MDLAALFPYAVLALWAISLVVNRKIVEKRISSLEDRVVSIEQSAPRSRSVGPRR